MTQLVVTLKDQSYLPNVRRIVKSLQGVEHVSKPRKDIPLYVKRKTAVKKSQATLKSEFSDPLEALESIGHLIRSTGKTSEQLIDEYVIEKYGV